MTARTLLDVVPSDLWGVTLSYLPPCAEKYLEDIDHSAYDPIKEIDPELMDITGIREIVQWGNVDWDDVFDAVTDTESMMRICATLLGEQGSIADVKEFLAIISYYSGIVGDRLFDIMESAIRASRATLLKKMWQLIHCPGLIRYMPCVDWIWNRAVYVLFSSEASEHTVEMADILELSTCEASGCDIFSYPIYNRNDTLVEYLLNSDANRSEMAGALVCNLCKNGVYKRMIPLLKRLSPDVLKVIAQGFRYTEAEPMLDGVLDQLDKDGCTVLAGLIRDMAP